MDDSTLDLVRRAQRDDSAAAGELFARYRDPLRRGLRRLIGEDYRVRIADSEDAAHDAILTALRDLDSFEYRGEGSFLAWLLKRAEYTLLNKVRASRRQRRDPGQITPFDEVLDGPGDGADGDLSVGGEIARREHAEIVRECIDQLPTRERDVLLLRQFLELDTSEIQTELGLPSQSAVRNLYARAQARLAIELGRREGP